MEPCAVCKRGMTPDSKIYVVGAHVCVCSRACYAVALKKVTGERTHAVQ